MIDALRVHAELFKIRLWKTILVDAIFYLTIFLIGKIGFFLIEQVAKEQRANLALFLAIIYIIALAIIYSAFKYKVIRIIMGKEQVSGKFYGFCILNCVVFSIFIICTIFSYY